ncbi:legumain-like [Dermacentor silvarum]|uniref:legumain-like n=1 Tax=Dermacentor silvarum TaxID=543639 RepID=UPI001897031A|nr:legumain-like [Dermacentor silvarum]
MMKDDIAHNKKNPTPGVIINHPQGPNVYKGVPKDYSGELVTSKNFLDILQGKKVKGGSGKVITSGPHDHIFINFAGHGAPGFLVFPKDLLFATEFNKVIKKIHTDKKFANMVIYIEACQSGSMFEDHLPDNVNVYATTAANSAEFTWACYLDEKRHTYLGDCYSVNWMEDADKADLHKETVIEQYEVVKNGTSMSHVQQFGDSSVGELTLKNFLGYKKLEAIRYATVPQNPVLSRDVPVTIFLKQMEMTRDGATKKYLAKKLQELIRDRNFVVEKVTNITSFVSTGNTENATLLLSDHRQLRNVSCYEQVVRHFNEYCFSLSLNAYVLSYAHVLVNMCESGYDFDSVSRAMDLACTHPPVVGIV